MFMRRKTFSRGASSNALREPRSWVSFTAFYPIVMALVLCLAGAALYMGVVAVISKPVARVVVNGEFRHVNREVITEQVKPLLARGFVQLNLQAMRESLKTQPWIYDVNISRVWPDEISIDVIEQKPIARWADVGYLNHRGILFKPEKMVGMNELPLLSGPDNSAEQVMTNFVQLSDVLQHQGLVLKALSMDQRGNWQASLDNEIAIVLGSTQIMEKMHRFVTTYQLALKKEFGRVSRIDMRYSNGLAVAWRDPKPETEQSEG